MAVNSVKTKQNSLTSWNNPAELMRVILVLALPVTATNVLQALIGFVDVRMISALGTEALASLGVGRQSIWLVSAVFLGLGTGITAYVARFTGAQDHKRARAYATVGVVAALVIGVFVAAIGLLIGGKPVMYMVSSNVAGTNPEVIELTRQYAWDYFGVILVGMVGIGAQFAVVSIFNSLGRTIYPMWLLIIANFANFIGNWLLIGPYKVAGCAVSTILTSALVTSVAIVLLTRQRAIVWDASLFEAPVRRAWEMLRVGIPGTLQVLARSLAGLALVKLITFLPNSVVGQSALVVGLMTESLAFMPAFAFSVSAATLTGQNLGAKQPDKARASALYCLLFSEMIMWGMGSLLFFYPQWFITLFTGGNSPELTEAAVQFLRIIALCLPGLGVAMTMGGVLRGSGDTKAAALITLTAMWFIRIPLAAFMSLSNIAGLGIGLGLGLNGVWWAMTISVYVEATLAFMRFTSGRWASVELADI